MQNNQKKERILIATGIYPPEVGGPAQYALSLEKNWKKNGHAVVVKYFGKIEKILPTGFRHFYFLLKSTLAILRADKIFVLDTWSAALPIAVLSSIFRKKFIVRTGGDFLWESYLERTQNKITFTEFYGFFLENYDSKLVTKKERIIFTITKWILKKAHKIVFSTNWQREVWCSEFVYNIPIEKTLIIENFYGEKLMSEKPEAKVFLGATRPLVWKNLDLLKEVFEETEIKNTQANLDLKTTKHEEFLERMKKCYAVILVSLGDISPNMILDAIRFNKPFIVTNQLGIYERIKDIGIFVDPENTLDIKQKILWLCDEENYKKQQDKISTFDFSHSWEEIGQEFLNIK